MPYSHLLLLSLLFFSISTRSILLECSQPSNPTTSLLQLPDSGVEFDFSLNKKSPNQLIQISKAASNPKFSIVIAIKDQSAKDQSLDSIQFHEVDFHNNLILIYIDNNKGFISANNEIIFEKEQGSTPDIQLQLIPHFLMNT